MDECKSCGHNCHCDKESCPDCINDVCYDCKCNENRDIPMSFTQENV